MPRLFLPPEQFPNITGPDLHYVKNVLRLKQGDQLELFDGSGKIYTALIAEVSKEKIVCAIQNKKASPNELSTRITLAQALPKGSKMDFIVEKCTELGVSKIIPFTTARTIAKGTKTDRWKKLAKEAAEQSGRAMVPIINGVSSFSALLSQANKFALAIMPWEGEKHKTLKQIFTDPLILRYSDILIIIGPEGGFSAAEIDLAEQAGVIPVSLGKRILRTETAGMAVLAMLNYALE